MNRYTFRDYDGSALVNDADIEVADDYYGGDAIERLAAYEDSTRSPEEVQAMNSLYDYVVVENTTLEKTVKYFRRLLELAEADMAGRVVVLSKDHTDKDGEEALKKAMYICNYNNNGVTRYTADAIAEKLSREEAKQSG